MSRIVGDIVGHRADPRTYLNSTKLPSILTGLEIELENVLAALNTGYWTTVSDGSLRNNGCEFVFSNPLMGNDIEAALQEMGEYLAEHKDISLSHRCSVHVHVDVRGLTTEQLLAVVLCAVATESALFTCAGKDRYSNIYCPGFQSCYSQVQNLGKLVYYSNRSSGHFQNCLRNWVKYSGINLKSVSDRGSIEFRMFQGTKDISVIYDYVSRVLNLVDNAKYIPLRKLAILIAEDCSSLLPTLYSNITEAMQANFNKYMHNNRMNALDALYLYGEVHTESVREPPSVPAQVELPVTEQEQIDRVTSSQARELYEREASRRRQFRITTTSPMTFDWGLINNTSDTGGES